MRILITGGGGFVGKNLIKVMKEEGFNPADLTVLDRSEQGLSYAEKQGAKVIRAELSEKGAWTDAFSGQDIVVSLQARISGPTDEEFQKDNVWATRNIVEAAKNAGAGKIIHFSSAAVLSVRKDSYAKTKEASEEIVKSSGLRCVILQPSLMYGMFDDKNIGWLIGFAKKIPFFPIPGSGKYPRQPIYVDDICRLVIKLINDFPEKNEVYSVNGRDVIYFRDMIKIVLKKMKGIHFPVYIPIPVFIFLVRVYDKLFHSPFTPDQIKSLTSGDVFPDWPWWEEFNVKITSFEEGVGKMLSNENQP